MEDLVDLLNAHAGTPCRKVLVCSGDIWRKLEAAKAPVAFVQPLEFSVNELTGIEAIIAPGYELGRWKLIRHDHCGETGGEAAGQYLTGRHPRCTVIAEHDLRKMRPADMTDEEFMLLREISYRRCPDGQFGILEFFGMSPQEYADWFLQGVIPERVMRAEGRRGPR